jgi:hypothetical protein
VAAVVQSVSVQSTSSSATSATATLPGATLSGNLLVMIGVDGLTGTTEAATPASDNGSHTWQAGVATVFFGATRNMQRFVPNIAGRAVHTFTYTAPSTGGFPAIAVAEISDAELVTPLDATSSNGAGTAATNPHGTGLSGTLSQADCIAIAGMTHTGTGSESFDSAQGFTIETSQTNTANMPICLSSKVLAATTSLQEQYNLTPNSSVIWAAHICVYQGSGAVGSYAVEGYARHSPRA